MKPIPVDETFGSIESHLRRAREQRAAFLADLLSSAVVTAARAFSGTAGRAFSGTAARVARVTRATARPPEPAAR